MPGNGPLSMALQGAEDCRELLCYVYQEGSGVVYPKEIGSDKQPKHDLLLTDDFGSVHDEPKRRNCAEAPRKQLLKLNGNENFKHFTLK